MATQSFWDAAANLISITENHPFLVSMVDGSLSYDNFRYYAIQDAIYLTDFAKCLHMLGDKLSSIDANKAKQLHQFAVGAEEDEKEMHRTFFKGWGDMDMANEKAMPSTLLYTSYLIRIVATRPLAEGLTVMLPCFWVYHHVGKCMLKLRDELGPSVTRLAEFDAWIDMYSGDDFEKVVSDYKDLVDDIAKDVDDDTLVKMKEEFIMACKLEHCFWDAASNMERWPECFDDIEQ